MTPAPSPPRVLELGAGAATGFAARLFVLLGADVVKVELLPDGDPSRSAQPRYRADGGAGDYGVAFHYMHQGKRSIALDLDDPSSGSVLADLLSWCEVALVDQVFAADPRIRGAVDGAPATVRTFVTPFGATGPYAGHESLPGAVFALGGELAMLPGGLGYALYPDAPPLLTRGNVAEFDGGVIGALVALASLYPDAAAAPTTDVSSAEACVSLNRWLVSHFDESGWVETRASRSYPYAGMFECADGYVMIQPSTEHQWTALVEMMGRPEWALNPDYATRAQRNEAGKVIATELKKWLKTRTKAEILEGGMTHGVPAAPFRDASEVRDCAQYTSRRFFVPYGDDPADALPGLPFALSPFGEPDRGRAPDLGEHTAEILDALAGGRDMAREGLR